MHQIQARVAADDTAAVQAAIATMEQGHLVCTVSRHRLNPLFRPAGEIVPRLHLELAVLSPTRGTYARSLLCALLTFAMGPKGDAVSKSSWLSMRRAVQQLMLSQKYAAWICEGVWQLLHRADSPAGPGQSGSLFVSSVTTPLGARMSLAVSCQVVDILEDRREALQPHDKLPTARIDEIEERLPAISADIMFQRAFPRPPSVRVVANDPSVTVSHATLQVHTSCSGFRVEIVRPDGWPANTRVPVSWTATLDNTEVTYWPKDWHCGCCCCYSCCCCCFARNTKHCQFAKGVAGPREKELKELVGPEPALPVTARDALTLLSLPDELLVKIVFWLDITDVLAMEATCVRFKGLCADPLVGRRRILLVRPPFRLPSLRSQQTVLFY